MNRLDNSVPPPENGSPEDRLQSPPAFLDLADSAARLGTNMSDISARVELKRMEHDRQRAVQRKFFEDQMRMLEHQQAQELLNIPYDSNSANSKEGLQHLAVSAPTTPPRVNAILNGDLQSALAPGRINHHGDVDTLSKANKRKSVTYAPSVNLSPDLGNGNATGNQSFSRTAGAKSMPASRRTSASSNDEELAGHLHNLSLIGERHPRGSPAPVPISASILTRGSSHFGNDEGALYAATYNAGMLLDEQLDKEMHNAMLNLPTSDDDKYQPYSNKISTSSAALDLAHISQTSPRASFSGRAGDPREKSSEWPQFNGSGRAPEPIASQRRSVTNPSLGVPNSAVDNQVKMQGAISATSTPLVAQNSQNQQRNQASRRSSPPGLLDGLSSTRSVPATPLGMASAILGSATPQPVDVQGLNGRHQFGDTASELQASLSRVPSSAPYDGLGLGSFQSGLDDALQPYGVENTYGLNNNSGDSAYSPYGYDGVNGRTSTVVGNPRGSTALYHHNGSRYGLGLPGRVNPSATDSKMNGLHGPKHKRGDVDREFNRYAGARLEDMQGEIPILCKDQHGCRYLQKKLEEGVPEHRDMIFRETFGHFAELMTDPFGNYLCQKLLEYSTDEQRNVICESVAQDLVNISLNMHGTRAVQKMIDFLSSRRSQTDVRYNSQIHSIILALSLHVVVLIKDLNGNHVIQKCLNKLAPEDNQFIYNAVAANCVEVATHRHGCCVLQRCIDHASDHQRVQLVNEITYNALTLVQDPYGNYVVQYILDLNDSRFSDGVIRQFTGNVCALSVQKFSSNVIEKCVRVAEPATRKLLIDELLNRTRLEKLLRDSYGNYCVQTALDYADPTQRTLLVEGIRPVLPLIRNTPYGKRIQNKLQREQLDPYGGYSGSPGMGLGGNGGGLGMGGNRPMHQGLHQGNPMADMYNSPSGLFSLPQGQHSFGQSHLGPQLHNMQGQSLEGYVLQGGSQGVSPSHSLGNNFSGGYFPSTSIPAGLSDPYQRQSFGYGM